MATLPEPEFGPAMRALNPRWQKAVMALFVTGGNRAEALRIAGYKTKKPAKDNGLYVTAARLFADDRVRAAIREEAARHIEITEPELLATTMSIIRDIDKRDIDRLRAIGMVWDRANPVLSKHKIEVEHHLSVDEQTDIHPLSRAAETWRPAIGRSLPGLATTVLPGSRQYLRPRMPSKNKSRPITTR